MPLAPAITTRSRSAWKRGEFKPGMYFPVDVHHLSPILHGLQPSARLALPMAFLDKSRTRGEKITRKAMMIETQEMGFLKKTNKSPRERTRDCRTDSSAIRPRTKARTRGAGSYSNFFIK